MKKLAETSSTKNMQITPTKDNTKKHKRKLLYKRDAIWFLKEAGLGDVAEKYRSCCTSFFVDVCEKHPDHDPRAIPKGCHLRICEHCEHLESYRKLQRYMPTLERLSTSDHPEYRLYKLVLTTPYSLSSLTSESFKEKQSLVNDYFSVCFFWYFHERGELSKAEIRSGRCNLKSHGLGWLCAAEFGERGKKLHWHCLCYAPFIPHMDACAIWRDVTNGECQNTSLMSIYADPDGEVDGKTNLHKVIEEIVKYATKFSELTAQEIPQVYNVLKGNRRFRSGGILNGIELPDSKEHEHTCEQCGAERKLLSVGQYVTTCLNRGIPVDDIVADAVENGIRIYLSSEHEISSGKSPASYRKARDSIESER